VKIVFGAYLREKCIDLRKIKIAMSPHSMLDVLSNTVQSNKKLSCRRETARRFVSLNTLL